MSRLSRAVRPLLAALSLAASAQVPWQAQAQVPARAQDTPQGALGCDPGERVLRFSHVVVTKGHPKGEAAAELAAEINSAFEGRMCMRVYPNSTLFDDSAVLDAMLRGEVEFAAPSLSKLEKYTKAFRIFDLPFLFPNLEAAEWFQNSGPGQRLRRQLDGSGLRAVAFWNAGMKQFSATRPLLRPGDATGLTFRVQKSEVLSAMIRALGAKARPLPFKDVRDALRLGDVQGQENSWANIYSKGFYQFQDGVTESNHGLLAYAVMISDALWKSLPPRDRPRLNQVVLRVTARANARARRIAQRNREALLASGVTIRKLSGDDRQAWVAKMRPVWRRFSRDIGEDLIFAAERASLAQ